MATPKETLKRNATYICDGATHLALSDDDTLSALTAATVAVWVIRSHMPHIKKATGHLGESAKSAATAIENSTGSLSQLLTLLTKKEAATHGAIATVAEILDTVKTAIGGH